MKINTQQSFTGRSYYYLEVRVHAAIVNQLNLQPKHEMYCTHSGVTV